MEGIRMFEFSKQKGEHKMYQQGDVLIKKCEKVLGEKLNHLVLAEGEATGHKHRVTSGEGELYEHEGTLFLKVLSDTATITHEEHNPITIPKGDYEIGIVQEYDHFAEEARNVQD